MFEVRKLAARMDKCEKCELLIELYGRTPESDRDYWIMTELFVMLHGSDICNWKKADGKR